MSLEPQFRGAHGSVTPRKSAIVPSYRAGERLLAGCTPNTTTDASALPRFGAGVDDLPLARETP
jgi:hypothetical protein